MEVRGAKHLNVVRQLRSPGVEPPGERGSVTGCRNVVVGVADIGERADGPLHCQEVHRIGAEQIPVRTRNVVETRQYLIDGEPSLEDAIVKRPLTPSVIDGGLDGHVREKVGGR